MLKKGLETLHRGQHILLKAEEIWGDSIYSPKESVPALSEFVVICEVIVFFDAPPRLCSLVCHVLFPNMSPV